MSTVSKQRPGYHRLEEEVVVEEVIHRPPGRPRRDVPIPTVTRYLVRGRVLRTIKTQRRLEGAKAAAFVLITTARLEQVVFDKESN